MTLQGRPRDLNKCRAQVSPRVYIPRVFSFSFLAFYTSRLLAAGTSFRHRFLTTPMLKTSWSKKEKTREHFWWRLIFLSNHVTFLTCTCKVEFMQWALIPVKMLFLY